MINVNHIFILRHIQTIAVMKNLGLFFLLTLMGVFESCSGQSTSIQKGYKDWYIGNFRCGVYVPPSYDPAKKYPLVIYLHGKSDTTTRNMGWYHLPAALADPAIVLTPKCPLSETGEWGNSWSTGNPPMIKKIFKMIDLIKKQYNLDEDRFYIYGISMGAIGTFGLVQKYPDLFAGGYAVCGWGDPDIAPQLSKIPFWIFHGDQDDVVPVQGSRGVYNAVVSYGGKQIRYTEFKGVKHDAWAHLNNNLIYTWLLAQKKGKVHHIAPEPVSSFRGKVNAGNKIFLEWNKPSDSSRVDNTCWYYKIYRNNILIGEVDANNFNYTDTLSEKHTAYTYEIAGVNYYFKESTRSAPVQITLQ
jgi:poly(3-hydroxybutyrate) depolymerase